MKTPMSSNTKLTNDEECDSVDSTKYQGMIGSLLYLTESRPDIMFSVCLCARFQEAPKTSHLEANSVKFAKAKDKGKTKLAYAPKPKIPLQPKRNNPAKDSVCYHCKEVYDTGYRTHICNTSHRLRESRKLKHRALSLYVGNGMRAAVEAIKSFDLILPSGLMIVLDICHFACTITRGVVSISHLVDSGYIQTFTNYGISVSKDDVFYFNAIPLNGIYEIDMHNLYLNVSSIYNVNKRAKHVLDSTYLWHCHLGHINKKRMEMLQRNGILQPTHNESLEKCKSCISGKMAWKPFSHQLERAKDLL
ncbi:retrotransposon protein, putative, ty1-copia subclass [Tanacetum coccineum]